MNPGGAIRAVFPPVGFWEKGLSVYGAAFRVLIPENLRLQRPVQRQNRPAEPLTADRERNRLRAGAGVPIVKDNAVAVLTATALPADQGGCLFPPFCFPLPFSPKGLPAPFLRRVPALARSPQLRDKLSRSDLWTKCPEVGSLRCFPCRGIPFRTVIWFSRCSSSMNYPKSTPK